MKKVLWLIAILVLAGLLGWYYFYSQQDVCVSSSAEQCAENPKCESLVKSASEGAQSGEIQLPSFVFDKCQNINK